jgi:hypothetical protein
VERVSRSKSRAEQSRAEQSKASHIQKAMSVNKREKSHWYIHIHAMHQTAQPGKLIQTSKAMMGG